MVNILNFILISHTMLSYLPVFLYFIEIFFATRTNTLLFPQSSLPAFYPFFLWYIKDILISNKLIYFKYFSNNNLNYVTQLFYDTANTKEWVKLKHKFNLNNSLYFNWMQLIHSIPQKWKNIKINNISENLLFLNHQLIKRNILLSLDKLNSKELYLIQIIRDFYKPTSQIYLEKHFNDCVLDWKYIYILLRIVTSDPYTRYFQ